MKLQLNRELKIMFLKALKDGFIETKDLEKVLMKELPTFGDLLIEASICEERNGPDLERGGKLLG